MTLAFITHPDCLLHNNGPQHPEHARRLEAVYSVLQVLGLYEYLTPLEAQQATKEDLALAHAPLYIDDIFAKAPTDTGLVMLDPDTCMRPGTLAAALRAAGSGITAVDWVLQGSGYRAFCAIRPPGHHAESASASGFCLFNNVAVAARHALVRHGLSRVAILDFDVHHGNGTEHIVAGDPRILFCSSFQHPYYPFKGYPASANNCLNVPLERGTSGDKWRAAVQAAWFGPLERFAPELILLSAGFDAHYQDSLGGLLLDEEDYAWVTRCIVRLANQSAKGRIVSMLEGGYTPSILGNCVATHLEALLS